ncbi:MAG: hypothetical protein M0Z37_08565, partial [Nitrospiraceae bacterium]|nr:hypothetical protein [Nitrospiraceae bacterium]
MKQQYKILMSYFMKTKGWIVLISLFSASGCGVFDPTQIHTRLPAEAYELSMMSGNSFQNLSVTARTCSSRYMGIQVKWR